MATTWDIQHVQVKLYKSIRKGSPSLINFLISLVVGPVSSESCLYLYSFSLSDLIKNRFNRIYDKKLNEIHPCSYVSMQYKQKCHISIRIFLQWSYVCLSFDSRYTSKECIPSSNKFPMLRGNVPKKYPQKDSKSLIQDMGLNNVMRSRRTI